MHETAAATSRSVGLSIVAPCFDEEAVLPEFYARCAAVLDGLELSSELVLVNDGSRDGTWPIIQRLAEQDPRVVGVNLSRNHGHQLALTAGLHICTGRHVLIIDADLQDPPELAGDMLERMHEGYDVVYGQRRARKGESTFKRSTAAAFYRLIDKLSDTPIPRDTGDFRLISRRALDVLLSMNERHRFMRGMVSWIGFPQTALVYDRDARFAGSTKFPLRKMVAFAIDAITGFSVKPLAFASSLGVVSALLAVGLLLYAVIGWAIGKPVPGWASTVAAIALLGGAQLLVLGVIGEYLGRLYEQSKGRPLFIIQDIARQSPEPDSSTETQDPS